MDFAHRHVPKPPVERTSGRTPRKVRDSRARRFANGEPGSGGDQGRAASGLRKSPMDGSRGLPESESLISHEGTRRTRPGDVGASFIGGPEADGFSDSDSGSESGGRNRVPEEDVLQRVADAKVTLLDAQRRIRAADDRWSASAQRAADAPLPGAEEEAGRRGRKHQPAALDALRRRAEAAHERAAALQAAAVANPYSREAADRALDAAKEAMQAAKQFDKGMSHARAQAEADEAASAIAVATMSLGAIRRRLEANHRANGGTGAPIVPRELLEAESAIEQAKQLAAMVAPKGSGAEALHGVVSSRGTPRELPPPPTESAMDRLRESARQAADKVDDARKAQEQRQQAAQRARRQAVGQSVEESDTATQEAANLVAKLQRLHDQMKPYLPHSTAHPALPGGSRHPPPARVEVSRRRMVKLQEADKT